MSLRPFSPCLARHRWASVLEVFSTVTCNTLGLQVQGLLSSAKRTLFLRLLQVRLDFVVGPVIGWLEGLILIVQLALEGGIQAPDKAE